MQTLCVVVRTLQLPLVVASRLPQAAAFELLAEPVYAKRGKCERWRADVSVMVT